MDYFGNNDEMHLFKEKQEFKIQQDQMQEDNLFLQKTDILQKNIEQEAGKEKTVKFFEGGQSVTIEKSDVPPATTELAAKKKKSTCFSTDKTKEKKSKKSKEEKPVEKTNKQLEKEKKQRVKNTNNKVRDITKKRDKLGDWESKSFNALHDKLAKKTNDLLNDPKHEVGKDAMIYYTGNSYVAMNAGLRTSFEKGQATGNGSWVGMQDKYLPEAMEKTKNAIKFLNLPENVADEDMVATRHMNLFGLAKTLGVEPKEFDSPEKFEKLQGLNEGTYITKDEGFTSTSILKDGAYDYAKSSPVECRVLIPKGTHGIYLDPISQAGVQATYERFNKNIDEDVDDIEAEKKENLKEAKKDAEREFLLQAGTQFKVLKMGTEDTKYGKKLIVYMEAIKDNVYSDEKLNMLKDSNAGK